MVKDIVKQAIHIKMKCDTRNDLISPAEFCYAIGYAMSVIGADEVTKERILKFNSISEILHDQQPFLQENLEKNKDQKELKTLLTLLMECKLDAEINDEELKDLIKLGYSG